MNTVTKLFLIMIIAAGISMPQSSISLLYQNGVIKSLNPNAPIFRIQKASLNLKTIPLKVTGSKINTIFEMDSLDLFDPNLSLFATTKGFNLLDDGTGKKILYGAKQDTGTGTITSYYFNSSNFSVKTSFSDTSFKKTMITESDFFPLTDPNKLDFLIHIGGLNTGSIGSPVAKIYDNINGNSVMNFNQGENGQGGFFVSNVPTSDSYPNLDLNGDGLKEIIGLTNLGLSANYAYRYYVYNNFSVIDSIDETRATILTLMFGIHATTSADLNGDGIPELVSSVDGSPQFFQWDDSIKKFKSIATLQPLNSMYTVPENVDGSSPYEIVAQSGGAGDSLYIFDKSFSLKYSIKVPGNAIKSYFVKNVTNSSNKEIIVSSYMGITGNAGTFVYDLSKGTDPIWYDSTLEVVAVGDFKNDGKNHMLGIKSVPFSISPNKLEMLSYSGSSFVTDWTCPDTIDSFQSIAGPYTLSNWISLVDFSFFTPPQAPMNFKLTDLNGDGKNKFVFNVTRTFTIGENKPPESFYILVNSDGEVVDTLPGPYKNCYALAADLNNDGHDELLVTQLIPQLQLGTDTALVPRAWVFEYGGGTTGIKDNHQLVSNYKLEQNYPNPFNPSTTINFQVPSASKVTLKVYDVLGRELETLVNEVKPAGKYSINFNADKLASGVYIYRIQAGNYFETKKMIQLK
ncbi:MAG: T9SS type A sorting domain-containing protein [Ignavibacteriaceae bacterium]